MSKQELTYTLTPNKNGTKYFAHVVHNASIDEETALAGACEMLKHHVNPPLLKMIMSSVSAYLAHQLAQGNCVTIGDIRVGLAIEGAFESANAPFDVNQHRLKIFASPRKSLQTAATELAPINATATSHPAFENVWCEATPDHSLRGGEVCEANGIDFADASSGAKIDRIWLERADGKLAAIGEIRSCSATRLSFTLPEGIAPGEYILVAERPNNDGATRARARKKIRVR